MQEKEIEIAKWTKELEERRGKLDMQIDELERETATIKWRITQLQEFKTRVDEEAIKVAQPEVIAEKTELETKALAHLQGERTERRGQIAVEKEFCNALVDYLRSKLESTSKEPSA